MRWRGMMMRGFDIRGVNKMARNIESSPRFRRQRTSLTYCAFACVGLLCSVQFGCTNGCPNARGFDDDPTLDETVSSFISDFGDEDCTTEDEIPYVVVGTCTDEQTGDELLFAAMGTGFYYEARFFAADSERIVAQYSGGDVVDPICYGQSYWPRRVQCSDGTITEVHCGTRYGVGEEFTP